MDGKTVLFLPVQSCKAYPTVFTVIHMRFLSMLPQVLRSCEVLATHLAHIVLHVFHCLVMNLHSVLLQIDCGHKLCVTFLLWTDKLVLQADVVIVGGQGVEGGQAEDAGLVHLHILTMHLANCTR